MPPRSNNTALEDGINGLAPPNKRDDIVIRGNPRAPARLAHDDLIKMVDFMIRREMSMLRSVQSSLKSLTVAKAALKSNRAPRLVSGVRTATGGDETRNASILRVLCAKGPSRWGQIRDALAEDSGKAPTNGAVSGALWDLKTQGVIGKTADRRWYVLDQYGDAEKR